VNFAVAIVLSLLLNPIRKTLGSDETLALDYRLEVADFAR
jgi:hypothetical protein